MPIVADGAVAIRGDLSKFNADLKKAEPQVDALGQRLKSSLSPKALFAGLAGGLAGIFAASKAVEFIGDSIEAASNLGETVSKVGAIFGKEAVPALEEWAETAAETFGQSRQQALDAASTFAIFGKSAGLAGDDLIGFSKELTELSSDFASFFNTSPEDAITAIGAALRGESEPIRRYGVLLDEATLRQRALKDGIIKTTTQALTPQQRVLAAQAEILAQTSDAQGDYARTSDGLANTQRELQAKFADLQVEIGEALLPVMVELASFTSDTLLPLVLDLTQAVKDAEPVWDALGWVIARVLETAGDAEQAEDLADRLAAKYGTVAGDITRAMEAESARWTGLAASLAEDLEAGEPEVTEGAQKGLVEPIEQAVIDARKKAREEARAIPGDISDALIKGMDDIETGLDALVDLMENSLSDAAKIAKLKGILASDELAAGLLDERADVRAAAMQLRDETIAQLELIESGAADAAVDTGTTFAYQLSQQEDEASRAAADIKRAVNLALATTGDPAAGGAAIINSWINSMEYTLAARKARFTLLVSRYSDILGGSLPTAGPLQHPERGGRSIAEAWTENGLVRGLKDGWNAVAAALPSLDPRMSGLSMATAMAPAGTPGLATAAGVVENHWHLTVNGVPYTFNTRDEFIKALDDLSAFGDGRLTDG